MTNLGGTITDSQSLNVKDSPYLVSGLLKITKTGALNIPVGVTIAFGIYGEIRNYGQLDVGSGVTLTSNEDVKNSGKIQKWVGIKTYSGGVSNFNKVTIKHVSKTALTTSNGSLTINNSNISDCGSGISINNSSTSVPTSVSISRNTINVTGNGLTLSSLYGSDFIFTNNNITSEKSSIVVNLTNYMPLSYSNIFSSNTYNNYVELSGILQQNEMTLPEKLYKITGTVTIPKECTLTVSPGSKLFSSASGIKIYAKGKLNCPGTAAKPIIMTSINDPAIEGGKTISLWTGIDSTNTSELSLNYVDLRYTSKFAVTAENALNFNNSKISDCGSGVKVNSTAESQNVCICKNTINVTDTGVAINSLNKSNFEFLNNNINSGDSSIYINLTNYMPLELSDILRKNTYNNCVELGGTFQNDFDFPEKQYKLSAAIGIPENINVKFAAGSNIFSSVGSLLITVYGNLNCVGTAAKPILFTSINDPVIEGGKTITYWSGINSKSNSKLIFDYVQIRYTYTPIKSGGELRLTNSTIEESSKHAIYINVDDANDKEVYLKNNTLRNGKNYGIYFYKMNGGNFVFENNNISGYGDISLRYNFDLFRPSKADEFQLRKNTFDAHVRMDGYIAFDFELPKNTYELGSSFGLLTEKRLTIIPGSIIKKINSSPDYGIVINGILKAEGTKSERIIFTNYADEIFGTPPNSFNRWNGITINTEGKATLENVDIRKTYSAALDIEGRASLKNSTIQDSYKNGINISTTKGGKDIIIEDNDIKNTKIGLNIDALSNANFIFRNNNFSENGTYDIVAELTNYIPFRVVGGISDNTINGNIKLSGTLYSDLILPKRTYEFSNVVVGQGGYMQIEPGSIIKISGQINVNGTLMAAGKVLEPILMTGTTDIKLGDTKDSNWLGISISKVGNAYLDFVTIRNTNKAGLSYRATNTVICYGKLNLTNSKFEDAFTPTVLKINSEYYPKIKNNSFEGISNEEYAIDNNSEIIIDAKENYWGSSEGPSVSAINTSGGKLSDNVSYIPFDTKGSKNTTLRAELSINHSKLYKFGEHEKIVNVSLQGGNLGNYYIKLLYTWNSPNIETAIWHEKDEAVISSSGSVDFPFEIYETGTAYLKAVVYDKKDGNVLIETNSAKADISSWYYMAFEDNDEEHFKDKTSKYTKKVYSQAYVSSPNNMFNSSTAVKAYVSQNRFEQAAEEKSDNEKYANAAWKEYNLSSNTGNWSGVGKQIPECPVLITPKLNELRFVSKLPIKIEDIAYISNSNNFEYDSNSDVLFTTQNYWDKKIYASNIYDNISQQPGMVADYEPITFESNGKKYLVSVLKGQYYLSNISEIGIYELSSSGEYIPVSENDGISVKLIFNTSGYKITEKESQSGWLTIYKLGMNIPKSSLKLDVTISFSDDSMKESFVAALNNLKYNVTVNENSVSFQLSIPKFKQNLLFKEPNTIWDAVITKLFSVYNKIEPQIETNNKYDIFKDRLSSLSQKLLNIDNNDEIRSRYNEEIPKVDMTYRKNNIPLLYCNYPEHLKKEDICPSKETGLFQCLNRFTVKDGPGQIFYSYQGDELDNVIRYNFGILATTNSEKAVISIENKSHASKTIAKGEETGSSYNYITAMGIIAKESIDEFFYDIDDKNQNEKIKDIRSEYELSKDKPVWIFTKLIADKQYFSGNIRFLAHGSVTLSVYAFEGDGEDIKGDEPLYKYDFSTKNQYKLNFDTTKAVFKDDLKVYRQYSGIMNSYLLRANPIVVKLSDIIDKKSICFETNHRDDMGINVNYGGENTYEMLPINIAGTGYIASCSPSDKRKDQENSPLHNLANWGVEYHLKVAFVNDTGKDINIIYGCDNSIDTQTKYPIIIYDKKYTGENINPVIEKIDITQKTEDFKNFNLKITNGSVKYFNYIYILGTNSSAGVKHVFKIKL